MTIKMSKVKKIFFVATIFLSNAIVMGSYIIMPTVNGLYEMFADSVGLVNFIVSGSYLLVVLASPVASKLCTKFGTKTVLIIGAVFASVGGVFFMTLANPLYMSIMRAVFTIGYAFTQIGCVAYINEVYTDNNERAKFMGYYNAAMSAVGAVLSFAAGSLAVKSMQAAYNLHWIFVPYLVMLFFFIPSVKNTASTGAQEENEEVKPGEKKSGFGRVFWVTFICFFLFNYAFSHLSVYISVYVAENSLGNEALTGYLNTVTTVIGFFAALAFGWLYKKLGHKMLFVCYALTAAALFIAYFMPGVAMIYVTFALLGITYPLVYTFAFSAFPEMVPPERINDAIAFATAGSTLSAVVCSYVVTFLMTAIGKGAYTPTLIVPAAILVLIAVTEIINQKPAGKAL